MATFCCGFIDADPTQAGKIETRQRSLDVVNDDAPEPRVVLADEAGDGSDRHVCDERHGERFEQQREAGAGSGPRHCNLLDAAIRAGDARGSGVQ